MNLKSRIDKIDEKIGHQTGEILLRDRLWVISSSSLEEKEEKINAIQASLLEKYGTDRGVIYVDTGIVRSGD